MPDKVRKFLELIKFEHTVFALPFAYLGMMMARQGWPGWPVFLWTTLAMVSARTAGMTMNRLVDRRIDAANPRTRQRPSVTGEVSTAVSAAAAAISTAVFFLSAWMLNPLCLKLSPIALVFLSGYHYVKRWSHWCHFVLGVTLGMAPLGGWLAVTGAWEWPPLILSLSVMFWVAGFDILYSLQDMEFDKAYGLHSAAVKWGQANALKLAAGCHIATAALLGVFGAALGLGWLYWAGLLLVCGLLYFEHYLLAEGDLSKINTAFFTLNGWIGILLLIFTFLEIFR